MTTIGTDDHPLGVTGFTHSDLFLPDRLRALHEAFVHALATADAALASRYRAYLADQGASLTVISRSDLLVEVAPHVGRFVAALFGVEPEREAAMERTRSTPDRYCESKARAN